MREQLIDIVFAHVTETLFVDQEQVDKALTDWTLKPIEVRGELAGVVMSKGNQIHIVVKPEFHGKWAIKRNMARTLLQDQIDEYGPLLVHAYKSDEKALRFIERLGFKRIGENAEQITLRLEKPVHLRSK